MYRDRQTETRARDEEVAGPGTESCFPRRTKARHQISSSRRNRQQFPQSGTGERYSKEVVKQRTLCVAMASYLRHVHISFGEVARATRENIAMLLEESSPLLGKVRNQKTTPPCLEMDSFATSKPRKKKTHTKEAEGGGRRIEFGAAAKRESRVGLGGSGSHRKAQESVLASREPEELPDDMRSRWQRDQTGQAQLVTIHHKYDGSCVAPHKGSGCLSCRFLTRGRFAGVGQSTLDGSPPWSQSAGVSAASQSIERARQMANQGEGKGEREQKADDGDGGDGRRRAKDGGEDGKMRRKKKKKKKGQRRKTRRESREMETERAKRRKIRTMDRWIAYEVKTETRTE